MRKHRLLKRTESGQLQGKHNEQFELTIDKIEGKAANRVRAGL
jgi:hypothetical protein